MAVAGIKVGAFPIAGISTANANNFVPWINITGGTPGSPNALFDSHITTASSFMNALGKVDNVTGYQLTGGTTTPIDLVVLANCTINQDLSTAAVVLFGSINSGSDVQANEFLMNEITTPTPVPNVGKIYTKADNRLFFQDGAGVEHIVDLDTASLVTSVFGRAGAVVAVSGDYNISQITGLNKSNNAIGWNMFGGTIARNLDVTVDCAINQNLATNADVTHQSINLTNDARATTLSVNETVTPTPVPLVGKVYTKTDFNLYFQDSGGTEHLIDVDGAGAVTSVFGRTGVVVAVSGDYTANQITNFDNQARNAVGKINNAIGFSVQGGSPTSKILVVTEDSVIDQNLQSVANVSFNNVTASNDVESITVTLNETVTPTPVPNKAKIYSKNDNKFYFQDGSGVEHIVDIGSSGPVTSVFGRTGVVVAANDDYDISQITGLNKTNIALGWSMGGGVVPALLTVEADCILNQDLSTTSIVQNISLNLT